MIGTAVANGGCRGRSIGPLCRLSLPFEIGFQSSFLLFVLYSQTPLQHRSAASFGCRRVGNSIPSTTSSKVALALLAASLFWRFFFRPEPAPSVSLALSNHRFAQFQGKKRSVDDAIRVTNKSRRSIFSRRPNKTLHRQSQSNGD